MIAARLHSRLFEAAARDLDRQIRAQFVDESLRPVYLKDFQRQLHEMVRIADGGAEIGGRFGGIKRFIRRLLRQYLIHQARLNRMMVDRLSELHEDLNRLLDATEEAHIALREEMESRADALRTDLTEELRRWLLAGAQVGASRAASAEDRTIPAGSRLVLGTVHIRRPGYLHVDPSGDGPSDLSAPLDRLPAEPGTVAEVVVANLLEQFPAVEVRGRLLPYWATLLRPGGRLVLIADDIEAAADRFRDGQIDLHELTECLFGAGGPVRRSAYTPEMLRRYVAETGLTDAWVTDRRQRPETGAYGFELVASRPAA